MKSRGFSLSELIVYTFLLMLVSSAIYGTLRMGNHCHSLGRSQVDVQRTCNLAMALLQQELTEAQANCVEFFPKTGYADQPVGVVFLSARDGSGRFRFDPVGGWPQWQRYVGYYLDADPQGASTRALYRAELVTSNLPSLVPVKGTLLSPAVGTAQIRANGQQRRMICRGLAAPSSSLPRGGFDVYGMFNNARSYDATTQPIYVDLLAEPTDPTVATRSTLTISTRVQSKN